MVANHASLRRGLKLSEDVLSIYVEMPLCRKPRLAKKRIKTWWTSGMARRTSTVCRKPRLAKKRIKTPVNSGPFSQPLS